MGDIRHPRPPFETSYRVVGGAGAEEDEVILLNVENSGQLLGGLVAKLLGQRPGKPLLAFHFRGHQPLEAGKENALEMIGMCVLK